jgi:hypothetical protein
MEPMIERNTQKMMGEIENQNALNAIPRSCSSSELSLLVVSNLTEDVITPVIAAPNAMNPKNPSAASALDDFIISASGNMSAPRTVAVIPLIILTIDNVDLFIKFIPLSTNYEV